VRDQESGVRNQESGVRSQESGVRKQESGIRKNNFMNEKKEWPCVCVDIETLGTGADAVIIEIGAVCFDPATGELGATFQREVGASSQRERRMDAETVEWWMSRVCEGKEMPGLKRGAILWEALVALADFLREECAEKFQFWAWGVDFDAGILKHAHEQCFPDVDMPWFYANQRDARTFCVELGVVRVGEVAHRALPDAVQEADAVMRAFREVQAMPFRVLPAPLAVSPKAVAHVERRLARMREEMSDEEVVSRMREIVREVNRVDEADVRWGVVDDQAKAVAYADVQDARIYYGYHPSEVAEEEFRRAVLEESPDFEEGWNAYRRELLETVGMTMLPTWEKLPDQVRESWCVGVREALGGDR